MCEGERVFIEHLIIEITRRCNVRCDHCARGDAQDVTLQPLLIDQVLGRIGGVRYLTVSGGEPSLAVSEMNYLLTSLKEHTIEVQEFYLVTNAYEISWEFVETLKRFSDYACKRMTVCVSHDNCHPNPKRPSMRRLFALPFVHRPPKKTWTNDLLISEGRSKYVGKIKVLPASIDYERFYVGSKIYLNALGQVLTSPYLSYESQRDRLGFQVCDAPQFGVSAIEKFNQSLPLVKSRRNH